MAIVNTHYGFCAKGGAAVKFTYTGEYNVRDDGVVELLTSGTLVFLEPKVIDLFMVGGGGKGGSPVGSYLWRTKYGYGGGGGGYTRTIKQQSVQGSYEVVIGSGSTANSTYKTQQRGGASSFGNLGLVEGGVSAYGDNSAESGTGAWAGNGGSGGGGGVQSNSNFGAGGSDGANGENGFPQNGGAAGWSGGKGQSVTTREFGETTGKLYGGGGGGGRCTESNTPIISLGGSGGGGAGGFVNTNNTVSQAAGAGGANTGGGGGGGYAYSANAGRSPGGNGGSGIVCFRAAVELPELAGTWVLNERLYPSQTGASINESIKFTAVTPNGNFTGAKISVGYTATSTVGFYLNQSTTFAVYQFSNNKWTDSTRAISQITFQAGATASDEFRAWLASNATKQS